jgi:hypothetical protein
VIPQLTESKAGALRIWDHPGDEVEYVAGIDSAEGRKKDRTSLDRRRQHSYADGRPDYSVVIVLEMRTALHVATWRGYVSPDQFAAVCAAVGFYYNTALLVPELNGPGLAVVNTLSEVIRYPNIYRTRYFNVLNRDPFAPQLGWQTTATSRPLLITNVHDALNTTHALTRDKVLVSELRTMEFDDQGVARARGNDKDDCVMAFGMALQGRFEALGDPLREKPQAAKNSDRAMDDKMWALVRQKLEDRRERRTAGGRVYLGRDGSRMPRGGG